MARTKRTDKSIEQSSEFKEGYEARQNGLPDTCPIGEDQGERRKAWLLGYKRRAAEEQEQPAVTLPDGPQPTEWKEGFVAHERGDPASDDPYQDGHPKAGFWAAGWQHRADKSRPDGGNVAQKPLTDDRDRVKALNARGIDITIDKFRLLPDESIRTVSRWIDDQLAGKETPLPVCLIEYHPPSRITAADVAPPQPAEVPVKFGKFSTSEESMSIGIRIAANMVDQASMARFFNGRRIQCVMSIGDRQRALPGMTTESVLVGGAFEVGGFGVRPRHYSATLNAKLADVDPVEMMKLSCKSGLLRITDVATVERDKKPEKALPPPKTTGRKRSDNSGERRPRKSRTLADVEAEAPKTQPAVAVARDEPQILQFPAHEKLFLCNAQCLASLAMVGIGSISIDQVNGWTDETRDEVDVWAKAVAAAAADGKTEVPETPAILHALIPEGQFKSPVEFLQTDGVFVPRLSWYCHSCEEASEATGDLCTNCPQCNGDMLALVGYYQEPRCTEDGDFIVKHNEQFAVPIRPGINFRVLVSAVRGESGDRRYRCGLLAEHRLSEAADVVVEASAPNIRDNGRTTQADAIAATIGKLIGNWSKLDGPDAAAAVEDLKEYLGKIERGEDPKKLEPLDAGDIDDDSEVTI